MSINDTGPVIAPTLPYSALEIVLANQGLLRDDSASLTHQIEPIDFPMVTKIRETSKDLKTLADNTLNRMNQILPSVQLTSLDQEVAEVQAVIQADNRLPEFFKEKSYRDFFTQCLAKSRWLSDDAINDIVLGSNVKLKASLLLNENMPLHKRLLVGKVLLKQVDIDTQLALACDPYTHPQWLTVLSESKESIVRQAVARNQSTPASTLLSMAKRKDLAVQSCVARNPAAPELALNILASHTSIEVRAYVANHKRIPRKAMYLLAADKSDIVLEALAENPAVTSDILTRLVLKGSQSLIRAVASNPSAPPVLLRQLAEQSSWYTRFQIARNPASPIEALRTIFDAFNQLRQLPVVTDTEEAYYALRTMLVLAAQDHMPTELLWAVYRLEAPRWDTRNEWEELKVMLAENPASPEGILRGLMREQDEEIEEALSENPSLPADLASQIPDVYQQITQILAVGDPAEVAEILIDYELPMDTHERIPELYQSLIDLDQWEINILLAGDEHTPEFILQQLSDKEDFTLWSALAANQAFPDTAIEPLIAAVNHCSLNTRQELELATELVLNRTIALKDLAKWLFKSPELNDAIASDVRWQKVAARILDIQKKSVDTVIPQRPHKRPRLVSTC